METQSKYFLVNVEDIVVQATTYIVKAIDSDHAVKLVTDGVYAFESEIETVDNIESSIKSVEEMK